MPGTSETKQITNAIALLQKYAKKGMVGSQSSVANDAKKKKPAAKKTTTKKPSTKKKTTTKKK